MELCFSCSRSFRAFHPLTSSASVDHNTSINIAKMCVDVSDSFSATRNSITACYLYQISLTPLWGGAVRKLYKFVRKCWKLEICFI